MATTSYTIRLPSRCFLHVPRQALGMPFACRRLSTTASPRDEALEENISAPPPPPPPTPLLVPTPGEEGQLVRSGVQPVGSRRRRAALRVPDSIPFEQLPYQCFQEARKILAADREEKLQQIEAERKRIALWKSRDPAEWGGENAMKGRLIRMQKYLHRLKILADMNDPAIRMRFEDGQGDMNRPIYRFLAERKWRSQPRLLLMQRITQMHIMPDILPHVDPVAEVKLAFRRKNVFPGEFVASRMSEFPPRLRVQVFDQGERPISIVVVDPDVPNEEKDSFDYHCHFLALNIPISPTTPFVQLAQLGPPHTVLDWLPPTAQKGAPYHRLAIFVMQHLNNQPLDLDAVRQKTKKRERFNLRSFLDRHSLKPVGAHLFRSQWDEGTAEVMERANVPGANIEWLRKKVEKLPYKKKDGERFR